MNSTIVIFAWKHWSS